MTATTASEVILVDSSGWLEYLTSGPKSGRYQSYFASDSILLVPTIVLFEVRKILLRKHSQAAADLFVTEALRHTVANLDERVALDAAAVSLHHQLAMADAIVYTTAFLHGATLIASDDHFRGLPGVVLV